MRLAGSTGGTGTGSTTPTPTPCSSTGGGGGGANGGPADLFPCDSVWYRDVSGAAVSPESTGIIRAMSWGNGNKLNIDLASIVYMHTDGSAPKVKVTTTYASESNTDLVPIPPGGALEGETGYTCTQGGDCHLIVVDDSQHKLFELYAANSAGGTWKADAESVWDLTKHYGPEGRGLGCTSADAAGLPVMVGLIGVREARAGTIKHALRFILPNPQIRSGPSYVPPASHGTSTTKSSEGPPYGTRLRLKSSVSDASLSAGGKVVAQAMKKYGMILADGGQDTLTAEDDRFEKAKDPAMTWDGFLANGDLKGLLTTDFEVVEFSAISTGDNCVLQ